MRLRLAQAPRGIGPLYQVRGTPLGVPRGGRLAPMMAGMGLGALGSLGAGTGTGTGSGTGAGSGSDDALSGLLDSILNGPTPETPEQPVPTPDQGLPGSGESVFDQPPLPPIAGGGGQPGDIDAPTGINPLEQPNLEQTYQDIILSGSKSPSAYERLLGMPTDKLQDLLSTWSDEALNKFGEWLMEHVEGAVGPVPEATEGQVQEFMDSGGAGSYQGGGSYYGGGPTYGGGSYTPNITVGPSYGGSSGMPKRFYAG